MSDVELRVKQSLTSVDLAVVVGELKNLEGCVARSLTMPSRDLLLIELSCGSDVRHVVLEAGRRIHLTKRVLASGSVGVSRLFKKLLDGSRLEEVGQIDLERVTFLRFRRGAKHYVLYVELLPRGVIALTDESGKILALSRKLSAKDRVVALGARYVPPPRVPDIRKLSAQELAELSRGFGGSVGQFFVRALGVPPEVVNEALSSEERALRVSSLNPEALGRLATRVREILTETLSKPRPCAIAVSGRMISFHPFKPSRLPAGVELAEYRSMNDLLDDYFAGLDEVTLRERELSEIKKSEEAIERTLREAEENLRELEASYGELSRKAELFDRYYYEIETSWECSRRVIKEKGWSSLEECGRVFGEPSAGVLRVVLPEGQVELLVHEDLRQQYARLKRELEHLKEKVIKTRKAVGNLRGKLEELSTKRRLLESLRLRSRRVTWFTRFLWVETSNGFIAVGGRDASQNETVVRRYLGPKDIFMHADVHGASAFVIIARGREVPEEDLREVACVAASYSKAWKAGLASADVFWVYGEQVKLSAPPGEYLPRGSFMVYGQRNFIRDVRLALGIGVVYLSDQYDLVVGPPELIRRRAVAYVVVVPGDMEISEAAEEIRSHFASACPDIRGLTARDIEKLLPGRVRIVEKSKPLQGAESPSA